MIQTVVDAPHDSGCLPGTCPPLSIRRSTGMDVSTAPGFDATGFRCKALSVCGTGASCVDDATDTLGEVQSAEAAYQDGAELAPAPVKLRLDGGAASQCGNPPVTFKAGDYVTLVFDSSPKLAVYLPAFLGISLTLYIASDGSTFYDAGLTMPAALAP